MPITVPELLEVIKMRLDPDAFIEILDLSTDDLVDRFRDVIAENYCRFEYLSDEVVEEAWGVDDD